MDAVQDPSLQRECVACRRAFVLSAREAAWYRSQRDADGRSWSLPGRCLRCRRRRRARAAQALKRDPSPHAL
jgi:hypothetical protein